MNARNNINELIDFLLDNQPLFVITGAGCSTDSGIPDYRDQNGDWKHSEPIQFNDFMKSQETRQRYWARSMNGWPHVKNASPNACHHALTRLEQAGFIKHLVTQNVDGLHQQAGSQAIIDLHGTLDTVSCMSCSQQIKRETVQDFLLGRNPDFKVASNTIKPDGDANIDHMNLSAFHIPNCDRCDGILKPDVVFFGESVPRPRVDKAMRELQFSNGFLSVGSSLMVYSGYRFCRAASKWNIPQAALNLGRTRADEELALKVESHCGEALSTIVASLNC